MANNNKIDAHQHFWKFNPVRDTWINEDMKVIQKDFLPEDLQPLLEANGFAGCIAVQSDQSEEHNQFLMKLSEKNDCIKGIVGWVDLQAENINERLSHYSQFKKLKGFRHVLQGEKQRDMMLSPGFMHGISQLNQHGFVYDILIFPDQLKYIKKFVNAFPHQQFVIDHIAKPAIKEQKIDSWRKEMLALSASENLCCKVSGMVTEASWNTWKQQDFIPYLDAVVEAFGVDRIFFGSDWPVCLVAASYDQVVNIAANYFSTFSQSEQEKIFSSNASRFYHL